MFFLETFVAQNLSILFTQETYALSVFVLSRNDIGTNDLSNITIRVSITGC